MKFSEQWLREWVNPDVSTKELGHRLTMAGLEVDAIEPVAGEFKKVVVGEVLTVEHHPDADKLRVCQINIGIPEALQIVCGAPNVLIGMRVPTALVGATLPGGLTIKKSKLRGVESEGMLCSAAELGLADQVDGLLPLSDAAEPGMDVREFLKLDDVIIELGLTPNRGDCLGIVGLARETGVLFDLDVKPLQVDAVKAVNKDTFPVEVQAAADCPRYIGRVLKNINITAHTPMWMCERLRRGGIRSINPVVDVTNYVLLELGQPMHAFDLKKLHGGIWVRKAMRNEPLVLLDGERIKLDADTLVIADVRGPLALAGIMGGEQSAVTDESTDLFLESAYFNPESIAGRARRYGLHTDSSHRFERGVDPDIQCQAIERATALLLDIVGGEPGPVIDVTNKKELPVRQPITLRAERIERVLGLQVDEDDVTAMLKRLGMQVDVSKGSWRVTPPAFRFDISIEVDLIEEVGRIVGYDQLPVRRPQTALTMSDRLEAQVPLRRIRQCLVDRGYQEAISYSFIDPALQATFSPNTPAVKLANPIAADMAVMRTSLLPGLLEAVKYNQNRQQERVLLFESGIKYLMQDTEIIEEEVLSAVASGSALAEQWGLAQRAVDYYDVKSDVESLLQLAGCQGAASFELTKNRVLHPGQSARIMLEDKKVGWIGAIHPAIIREMGLSGPVFGFEIQLKVIQNGNLPGYTEVSRYPSIRRDIAIIVDAAITSYKVSECIKNAAGENYKNLELFDVYSGKGIDSGRKSLALGLTLQASSRTLTDADVETAMSAVLTALREELDATLRE